MEISDELLSRIESDLGLNMPYVKGTEIPVRNCWHFCTDGKSVEMFFLEREDFVDGMNRVYVVLQKYLVVILAFVLMDTHIHFVLYGSFDECNRFIHEYIIRTSRYIERTHGIKNQLASIVVTHQKVEDERFLKTVICYTVKNPPEAGLPYLAQTYPWSSGSLYFASSAVCHSNSGTGGSKKDICLPSSWIAPKWLIDQRNCPRLSEYSQASRFALLKTREAVSTSARVMDGIVFPGDYVAYGIVERLFRTCKSYNFFMCHSREIDIESRENAISSLSIPIHEMRQHKTELCNTMFGVSNIRSLDIGQRLALAKALKRKYYSSTRQIARLCGLVYEEIKDL